MKRKDEEKDDVVIGATTLASNLKWSSNTSPNISGNSSSNDANNANNCSTPGTVRTTGRVKKPKLVYDPSDNYISRGSRNLLTAPTPIATALPAPALAPAGTTQSTSPAQSTVAVQPLQHVQSASPPPQSQASNNIATVATTSSISVKEESPDVAIITPCNVEQQRSYDTCKKCGKSEPRRGSGYRSNYLTCKSCNVKWHFSCLPIAFEVLTNARQKYKCEDCRRCCICMASKSKSDVVKEFIMCCSCVNAYHLDCHRPHLSRSHVSDARWKCYNCDPMYSSVSTSSIDRADVAAGVLPQMPRKARVGRKKRVACDEVAAANGKKPLLATKQLAGGKNSNAEDFSSGSNTSSSETSLLIKLEETTKTTEEMPTTSTQQRRESPPALSSTAISLPSSPRPEKKKKHGRRRSADSARRVSDFNRLGVQKWSVEQVVTYVEKFYPSESNVFKNQEVDGAALLVLTRQDIIDRFGLKLGPALRIYELILGVQSSMDDVTLAWSN